MVPDLGRYSITPQATQVHNSFFPSTDSLGKEGIRRVAKKRLEDPTPEISKKPKLAPEKEVVQENPKVEKTEGVVLSIFAGGPEISFDLLEELFNSIKLEVEIH